jgi:soluble lytic murein transglycosylase
MGLLQIMPDTARRQARRSGFSPISRDDQIFEPETNIALGSAYLEYLAGRFPERMSATIGSYNAGPNAVSSWLRGDAAKWDDDVWVEDIPYDQTRTYVKRVLRSLHVYRSFY